ncbi:MAG TPA: TIGR02597 family protein [Candidatus Paceibacterota bacterium]|nr:TIGR02597 family protein [Candidatus Paceibacterota bacterium]
MNKIKLYFILVLSMVLYGTGVGTSSAWGAPFEVVAPAGFQRFSLQGNSDNFVTLPFFRPAVAYGKVTGIGGNTLAVSGGTAWNADEFVYSAGIQSNTYFVLLTSGQRQGRYFTILGNTEDTLMVDLNDDTLGGISVGDSIAVVPYWTLSTLMPGGKGIHVSTSPLIRKSEILFVNVDGIGINRSASKTFFYYGDSWKQFGQGLANKNDEVLLPDVYFIVRHNISTATSLTLSGEVLNSSWTMPVTVNSVAKQDNFIGLPRPVMTSLNNSGLIESGAFQSSSSPLFRVDELLVFDNAVIGKNRSASATYYHYNGAWRKFGAGLTDVGNLPILGPGVAAIIRKGAYAGDCFWKNEITF